MTDFVSKVRRGTLTGEALSKMVDKGTLSKSERRWIQKKAAKKEPPPLTPRQLLRKEIKAKKAQPRGKLSKEARNAKFSNVDETERARLKDEANFTICLGCRKRGHFLKDCPKLVVAAVPDGGGSSGGAPAAAVDGICFNCGKSDHILKDCKRPRDRSGKLPFASCFICRRTGHIARDCDQNPNGLYPQGGCCHICLQKTHLVRDCPERTEEMRDEWARRRAEQQQQEEDRELGPRVKGLTASDCGGGDDVDVEEYTGSDDEAQALREKRPKEDKKERKEGKRKDRGDEGGGKKRKKG